MKRAKQSKRHPHVFVPKNIMGAVDAQIAAALEHITRNIDNRIEDVHWNRVQDAVL